MTKNGKHNVKNKVCFSGVLTGWKKEYGQIKRRKLVLDSCRHDAVSAGNAMLFMASQNVGCDADAVRKAKADARYFFELSKRNKKDKDARQV